MSSEKLPAANPGGKNRTEGILKRIKDIEGIKWDVELAPVFRAAKTTISEWRRTRIPLERVHEYARENKISLEYLINGRGPIYIADMVNEPGAIYRVETDQDAVYGIAAMAYQAINEAGLSPSADRFQQLVKVLHREQLDTGAPPAYARVLELVKLME